MLELLMKMDAVILFYHFTGRFQVNAANWIIAVVPMLLAGGLGLAGGLIFSVLTARYRDLMNLLHLLVRLLMFVCPIFFALSMVPEKYQWIININPLTPLFELFRYAFIGDGLFTTWQLLYSAAVMILLLAGGAILFNKKADALLDVV